MSALDPRKHHLAGDRRLPLLARNWDRVAREAAAVAEGYRGLSIDGDALDRLKAAITKAVRLQADLAAHPGARPGDPIAALTEAQRRVLKLLAEGLTKAEIGAEMGVGESTVKSHTAEVYRALRARNAPDAVAIALRTGLLN
ncbi:hypothetical protein Afil01_31680 [Actinorhabdospora filicis]|uniref:HTH luxR-type domain-containing protein n=1 Tax=Actinorhabdospora filicis TaxID=1785913 RepID=A0A9W6SM59_9ACTN|nr:helix-turn-helix transcriptional regulator [Actinorhabdospora filicis]GLZ78361.1 hypothetical protein Afil01_31680 [Actinorhabdospora filicis]